MAHGVPVTIIKVFCVVSDICDTGEAGNYIKESLKIGKDPWYQILLKAVGIWTLPCEIYQGREFKYLIQGEALDWLALAERICIELADVVEASEREELLFKGQLPSQVSPIQFRELIGANKYKAHLNYWYGVIVEEALQLAVEEEVRKSYASKGYLDDDSFVEEAFVILYGKNYSDLIKDFRREFKLTRRKKMSLTDLKEFTYWLFKVRVKKWDPARVASDTRKGINTLSKLDQL